MNTTIYRINKSATRKLLIALISDLHDAPCDKILETLRANRPDLIAIAGDLINGDRPYVARHDMPASGAWLDNAPHARNFAAHVANIAPTYMSLGNHEKVLTAQDLDEIARHGIHILDNNWTSLDSDLAIGGLSSPTAKDFWRFRRFYLSAHPLASVHDILDSYRKQPGSPAPQAGWLEDFTRFPGTKILLCHHPEFWQLQSPYLAHQKIDLALSGHSHGGQIRILGKGLYSSGEGFFPRYTSGIHQGEHGCMVISRGLSNTFWIPRFFNPTEIVYIELS